MGHLDEEQGSRVSERGQEVEKKGNSHCCELAFLIFLESPEGGGNGPPIWRPEGVSQISYLPRASSGWIKNLNLSPSGVDPRDLP